MAATVTSAMGTITHKQAAAAAPARAPRPPPLVAPEWKALAFFLLIVITASAASAWFASRRTRSYEQAACEVQTLYANQSHWAKARAVRAEHAAALEQAAVQCDERIVAVENAMRERVLGAMGAFTLNSTSV
jgi:hypothetical protein